MARGMTAEDVARVAAEIQQRGEKVTNARVLAALGSGSATTATRLLQEWRAVHEPEPQAEPTVPNPPPTTVTEALDVLGRQIWQVATAEADLQLRGAYERHSHELAALKAERDDSKDIVLAVERINNGLETRIVELEGQLAAGQQREKQAQLDRAALERTLSVERETRQKAETRGQELDKRVADLNAELDRLHTTLAGERDERAQEREADQQQIAELTRAAQDAKGQLEGLRADLTQANQRAAGLETQLQANHKASEATIADLNSAAQDAKGQLDELRTNLAIAGERVAGLETQLQTSRETSEATVTDLRTQLDQARDERAQAQGALQPLRDQLETQQHLLAQALAPSDDTRETQVKPVTRKRPPDR